MSEFLIPDSGLDTLPSDTQLETMVYGEQPAEVVGGIGATAVEQLTQSEPDAAFEWPANMSATRGVTYTAPTGDA